MNRTCEIHDTILQDDLKSVSYTHLDVYKRQELRFIST